jgi:glucose/arabinose dehydrogenase
VRVVRASRVIAVATVLAALAGCSNPASQPSAGTRTAGSPAEASPTRSSTPATASAGSGEPRAESLASGLQAPWGLIDLGDGTFLISERDTKKILRVDGASSTPVRTIDEARPSGEGGLLGLAATADQSTVFAYYTAAEDNRIVAMSWNGNTLGEPQLILDGIPKAGIHNGGRMIIGPDGHLYVGTGDAGDSENAQEKSSLGGKILRITTEGRPAPGNPFGDEVYSFGHRNVQGLAFDDEDRLWASEFGSQSWDELNLITEGGNYGWPLVEGSGQSDGMTNPKVVWRTSEASPSGLAYWQGQLWMAGLRGERLWEIPVDGAETGDPVAHFEGEHGRLRTVVVSSDGQYLLLTASDTDGRGNPVAGDDQLLRISR